MTKVNCDEETSNGMASTLFKGGRVQITVGVSKMDCDTHEEMWDEMKNMLSKFD